MLRPWSTLNCKGRLLSLKTPLVMGILNLTPDSFYDGGRYQDTDMLLRRAEQMLKEGAAIIDVGGMSSRPGAGLISLDEELDRVIAPIETIIKAFPDCIISIDTIRAKVAKLAVEAGASIVNDISAGKFDDQLYPTVANLGVPYILMHMKGSPENMQKNPAYKEVVTDIYDFFVKELGLLRSLGLVDIVLDPGFGFGKSVEDNYRLLNNLHAFQALDLPLLCGISRKSMICKVLKRQPKDALNGTTALHMVALQQGAKMLRVHDVKEAVEVIKLWEQLECSNLEQPQ